MNLLIAIALLAQEVPREQRVVAAQKKYSKLVEDTERQYLESQVRAAKVRISEMRDAAIDPLKRGYSVEMADRGDGVFVEVKRSRAFESAALKERAIESEQRLLRQAESDLDLWKNKALRPPVDIPRLPEKLAVGQVGQLPPASLLERLDGQDAGLFRIRGSPLPVVVVGRDLSDFAPNIDYQLSGGYWVSGKRTIGRQSLFVIEPIQRD